ncbi:DinB family protein [Deinococcus sp. PESE-13]
MTAPLQDPAVLAFVGATPAEVGDRLKRELDLFWQHVQTRQDDWQQVQPGREWSPAQEVEHVMLINGAVTGVTRLLLSDRPLRPVPQEPGVLKDGKRQAPASALPSEQGVAWDEVQDKWAQSRAAAEEVSAQVRATPDRTFWHPFFGELDALDWQRMLASHVMSHRLLLERSAGQGQQGQPERQA